MAFSTHEISPTSELPSAPLESPEEVVEADQDKATDLAFGQRWKDAARPTRPSISGNSVSPEGRRKSSVQFHTSVAEETIRRESLTQVPRISISASRRKSSPPPPPTYQRGVSFDTFDNKDATDYSFTLNYKHKDYQHSRRSRTFLCGADQKDYSEFALEWLIDELVDDGDEIVCLRVVEKDSKVASDASIESGKYREEAKKLLDSVIKKNSQEEKAISLVMELAVGRVQDVIQRMIQIYEPAVLIVGTRGRNMGGMQGLLPGSVSKYCLQQSPIPVIVVRPSTKRLRKKKKRQLDPSRTLYGSILYQAQQAGGSHVLDKNCSNSIIGPLPEATDQEAAAVAKAIGLPRNYHRGTYGGHLARVTSSKSDIDSGTDSMSPTEGFLPAGIFRAIVPDRADLVMKSPQMAALAEDVWDDEDETDDDKLEAKDKNKTESNEHEDETEEDRSKYLGVAKALEERRPSVRATNPWLDNILKGPDEPRRLSPGPGRGHNRSRSR